MLGFVKAMGALCGHLNTQFRKELPCVDHWVDEYQKWYPEEVGPKNGHVSTQFSKELLCVHHS